MWRKGLGYLPMRARLTLASGVFVTVFCSGVWFFGALASPTAPSLAKLRAHDARAGQPTGAKLDASPATAPNGQAIPPQVFERLSPDQAAAANAQLPVSTLPNPPARPFRLDRASAADRARALACLTMAVYYEAANQGPDGEAAVAQVVLNRVRHPLFPKTVCGVVFEGANLPTGCQFTFTCDGSLGRRPSQAGWRQASRIAERALGGYVQKDVGEATHYHTIWVVPYWRASVVKLTQISAHVFYRWPGGLGAPAAFQGRYAGAEIPPPPIDGFDVGLAPVQVAMVETIVPPAPTVASAAPPVRLAMLAAEAPAALVAPPVVNSSGYFGRAAGEVHRPPVSSHW